MGGFARAMAIIVAVLIVGAIGVGVYNAGVTAGLAEAAQQAAASGEPVPAPVGYVPGHGYGYGPYWHGPGGFGFFGILFAILGIFLVIGLLRAAFGWGRWGGRGPGGPGGSGGWGGGSERLEEFHRELHRRDPGGEPTAGA